MIGDSIASVYREDDDDITMESSTESLGLDFQAINKYNNLLPYAEKLQIEAKSLLPEIKGQLGRAVMMRRLGPETSTAIKKLRLQVIT